MIGPAGAPPQRRSRNGTGRRWAGFNWPKCRPMCSATSYRTEEFHDD